LFAIRRGLAWADVLLRAHLPATLDHSFSSREGEYIREIRRRRAITYVRKLSNQILCMAVIRGEAMPISEYVAANHFSLNNLALSCEIIETFLFSMLSQWFYALFVLLSLGSNAEIEVPMKKAEKPLMDPVP